MLHFDWLFSSISRFPFCSCLEFALLLFLKMLLLSFLVTLQSALYLRTGACGTLVIDTCCFNGTSGHDLLTLVHHHLLAQHLTLLSPHQRHLDHLDHLDQPTLHVEHHLEDLTTALDSRHHLYIYTCTCFEMRSTLSTPVETKSYLVAILVPIQNSIVGAADPAIVCVSKLGHSSGIAKCNWANQSGAKMWATAQPGTNCLIA